jgi:hypothetical protein
MSFSSLDYCKKPFSVPPQPPDPPANDNQRNKLRSYLYWYFALRQAESFFNGVLFTMFKCMKDPATRNTETSRSLDNLINNLSPNNPMGLFMLYTTDLLKPWDNHHVLAYKIQQQDQQQSGQQLLPDRYLIFSYDPNQSRTVPLIITATKNTSGNVDLRLNTGKTLYGFFVNNSYFARKEPPNIPYPLP